MMDVAIVDRETAITLKMWDRLRGQACAYCGGLFSWEDCEIDQVVAAEGGNVDDVPYAHSACYQSRDDGEK